MLLNDALNGRTVNMQTTRQRFTRVAFSQITLAGRNAPISLTQFSTLRRVCAQAELQRCIADGCFASVCCRLSVSAYR
jgi:hypothetical protein